MKKIELREATNSLAQYASELGEEPLVLTDGGHAIAVLIPLDDDDIDSMALSLFPEFNAIIERARDEHRKGESLSAEEARRALGIS
jgi:antitoxin (DNA-binding transcriptional repressor) of toxin-antitoxin stability system